jgi:hypothetical protein
MTIEVRELDDGNILEISWDPDDPVESVFNDWTEENFLAVILKRAREVLAEHYVSGDDSFEKEFLAK